jgi:hypothetical protein
VVEAVRRLCALFLICTHSVHFRVSSRLWLCHTAMEVDRPQVPLGALPTAQWLQCNDLVDRDETFLTRLIRKQVSDLQFEVKLCVRKLQGTHAPITKQTAAWLLRRERRSSARECSVLPCRLLATRAQVLPGTSSDVGCMPHCREYHTAYSTVPSARRAPVSPLGQFMRPGPACLLWALPCGGLQSLTHGSACHSSVGGRDHGGTCHAQNCYAGRSEEDAGREGEESDRRVCVQSYCVGVAFSRGRGLCDSVLDSSHSEDAIDVPTERVRKRLLFMTRA